MVLVNCMEGGIGNCMEDANLLRACRKRCGIDRTVGRRALAWPLDIDRDIDHRRTPVQLLY